MPKWPALYGSSGQVLLPSTVSCTSNKNAMSHPSKMWLKRSACKNITALLTTWLRGCTRLLWTRKERGVPIWACKYFLYHKFIHLLRSSFILVAHIFLCQTTQLFWCRHHSMLQQQGQTSLQEGRGSLGTRRQDSLLHARKRRLFVKSSSNQAICHDAARRR